MKTSLSVTSRTFWACSEEHSPDRAQSARGTGVGDQRSGRRFGRSLQGNWVDKAFEHLPLFLLAIFCFTEYMRTRMLGRNREQTAMHKPHSVRVGPTEKKRTANGSYLVQHRPKSTLYSTGNIAQDKGHTTQSIGQTTQSLWQTQSILPREIPGTTQ